MCVSASFAKELEEEIVYLKAQLAAINTPTEDWLKQKLNDIANGRKP
jgi:hypothetical protein